VHSIFFSLRKREVWIQCLRHRGKTTKQAKKAISLEKKDNKLRRPKAPNPTKQHDRIHDLIRSDWDVDGASNTMTTKHPPREPMTKHPPEDHVFKLSRLHPVGVGRRPSQTQRRHHILQKTSDQASTRGRNLHTSRRLPRSDWDIDRVSPIP
jgi:hypothetical protein